MIYSAISLNQKGNAMNKQQNIARSPNRDHPITMHNEITKQAAQKLESKLLATSIHLAVFVLHGSWIITRVTTQSFKDQVRLTPERLVGVYTADISVQEIADDFALVGIK